MTPRKFTAKNEAYFLAKSKERHLARAWVNRWKGRVVPMRKTKK